MSKEWLDLLNQRIDLARTKRGQQQESQWFGLAVRLAAAYRYLADQLQPESPQAYAYRLVASELSMYRSMAHFGEWLQKIIEVRHELASGCLPQDRAFYEAEIEIYQQVLVDMHSGEKR